MSSMQELDSMLDDLEEKIGADDDIYCDLVYDFQNISDSIKNFEKQLIAALSK